MLATVYKTTKFLGLFIYIINFSFVLKKGGNSCRISNAQSVECVVQVLVYRHQGALALKDGNCMWGDVTIEYTRGTVSGNMYIKNS